MKNLQSRFYLVMVVIAVTFLSSCQSSVLGQDGTLNQAIVGHAIVRPNSLNTNIQGYLVGVDGKVGLRINNGPVANEVDLNWYIVVISIFIAPGGSTPAGKASYFDQKYQAWCYDDLAIIKRNSIAWTNLNESLSNLTGSTTIGNRTFVSLTFYESVNQYGQLVAVASDHYNPATMYIDGSLIYKKIVSAAVMKY